MAFLTIIAPMVAMTYPIDKLNDGKAQAFSMWLKEYIFNLLIQPMHLLLYTILISSAYKLAATNAIYSIVAIGFIMPAEQMVRKFFGFTKAQTAGALSGAAGAALAYTGLQNVMKFSKKVSAAKDKKEKPENDTKWTGQGKDEKHSVIDSALASKEPKDQNKDKEGNAHKNGQGNGKNSLFDTPKDSEPVTPAEKPKAHDEGGAVPLADDALNGSKKPENKKEKIEGSAIRGAVGLAGAYFRQLGAKSEKRIRKQKPIRALARGASGLYGGAVMGLAGAALGVASGDASKVVKYGTAGAMGGYSAGKAVGGRAVDELSVDSEKLLEGIETSLYGENYKNIKLEENFIKMSRNQNNISQIRQYFPELSHKAAASILSGDIGRECFNNGIGNMEDIAAVYEAVAGGNLSIDEAIAGIKFNNKLPSKAKEMDESKIIDTKKQWADEYGEIIEKDPEKYKGLTKEELADRSFNLALEMGKIKGGLTDA